MERACEERRRLVAENQDMLIDLICFVFLFKANAFPCKHRQEHADAKRLVKYTVDRARVEARVMICRSFARRSVFFEFVF